MTELMKRYEAETDEMATWSWHNKEFVTDDVLDWASEKIQALDVENTQLKAQLTWRPVSEKLPSVEKDGNAVIVKLEDLEEGRVRFDVVSTVWFIHNYESWYTHWLPIPPVEGSKS